MLNFPKPTRPTLPTLQECGILPDASLDKLELKPRHQGLVFSFFTGSGFLDLGFEQEGFLPVLVNEFHPAFLAAYKHSRAQMNPAASIPPLGYLQGTIEVLKRPEGKAWLEKHIAAARNSGKPFGFIGGPPCPDFSNAGKHRGKHGDHGRLTKVYVDLITTHLPDFFVFENVKGLLRNHSEHLEDIERQFGKAGYRFTTRLANALDYGVPQDRERVVIVGFHKSLYQRAGLRPPRLRRLNDIFWQADLAYNGAEIKKLGWPSTEPFIEGGFRPCPPNLPTVLTVEHWFQQNHVERHPNALKRFQPRKGLLRMQQVLEGDISRKSFKRLHRWRYAATAAYGNNEVHLHPSEARRLSAAEALALQSMPQAFELPNTMTLSDMFKTIGNGVPFLMSRGVARSVKRQLASFRVATPNPAEEAEVTRPLHGERDLRGQREVQAP